MIKAEYLNIDLFLKDKNVLKLFRAVTQSGGVIRFVGGAVRDALAGLKGFDLDLATDLSPDELVEACHEAGLKTVPIGLKTATTGVVIDNNIYEVSSLHKHAKGLEFTDDWNADASRRDLTINAVYADEQGNVFDYYDGISDLEKGIVRFIGNPDDRIRENPIRIMRFFRFYSIFGQGMPDEVSLKACLRCKDLLRNIAVEQIRDELFKIFITPKVVQTLQIMFDEDFLSYILPVSENLHLLYRLDDFVEQYHLVPDSLQRLFILYFPNEELAENLAVRLHLTKIQKKRLMNWAKFDLSAECLLNEHYLKQKVYEFGKDFCKDKILFLAAQNKLERNECAALCRNVENMPIPIFPVTGQELLKYGVTERCIGKALEYLKSQWIASNFALSADELYHLADKFDKC